MRRKKVKIGLGKSSCRERKAGELGLESLQVKSSA
jgi:hypothetical protein